MRKWIIKYLCWISLLFFTPGISAHPLLLNGADNTKWNFTLTRGSMSITGICIVKITNDGMLGSVVNEFGIHAFDMIARKKKLRVKNVMPMINKWYIRKLLQNDLRILTSNEKIEPGKKRSLQVSDSTIILKNKKYDITYYFESIKQDDTFK